MSKYDKGSNRHYSKPQPKDTTYYVYVHYTKSTKQPYYVAVGKGNQANKFTGRNPIWTNMHIIHGTVAVIVRKKLTYPQALAVRDSWITQIGTLDKGTGPLINKTT